MINESKKTTSENLLDSFKKFEISGNEIQGGKVTGCSQNGSTTSFDSDSLGCNFYTKHDDSPGLCGRMRFVP